MKIKYCKTCLIPNLKPHIIFSKEICSACLFHKKKNDILNGINWKKRKNEFQKIISNNNYNKYKNRNHTTNKKWIF